MSFGIKLQNLRKERGLSQEALAEKLNVSRQAVSKWETCEGYPEIDKLIMISQMFEVSLDYLMKDQEEETQEKEHKYFMGTQKIQEYMTFKKNFALRIAGSVWAIIMSVNIPVLLEHRQESLGAAMMLVVIALAVALLIVTGMSYENYEELEKQEIYMSFQDSQDLQNRFLRFKEKFGISIGLSVCLIIMSVAVVAIIDEIWHNEQLAAIVLLTCVAVAVFVLIYQGITNGMYQFLVQNKKFVMDKKREDEETSLFAFTMPLAAMFYLFIGFTRNMWHPGWIVFPVVAIITWGIEIVLRKKNGD